MSQPLDHDLYQLRHSAYVIPNAICLLILTVTHSLTLESRLTPFTLRVHVRRRRDSGCRVNSHPCTDLPVLADKFIGIRVTDVHTWVSICMAKRNNVYRTVSFEGDWNGGRGGRGFLPEDGANTKSPR